MSKNRKDDNAVTIIPPVPVDPELEGYKPEITKEEIREMTALQPRDIRAGKLAEKNGGRIDPTAAMRVVARRFGPISMKSLAEIAQDIAQPGIARVKAAEILLQYGYGKPGLWVEPRDTSGVQNQKIMVSFDQNKLTIEEAPKQDDNEDDNIEQDE